MHRAALLLLLSTGCLVGTRARERDDRLFREIARQERWAQDAVQDRATPDELSRIRQSDYAAVSTGRRQLRKLLQGIDRGTWVREAVIEALRAGEDDSELLRSFDRAGQLRHDAAAGADELADALADAHGSLAIADLRPGFEALRKARDSEARLPSTIRQRSANLLPAPLPSPRPLVSAAAKVLRAHPEQQKEVDRLPADDAAQVRSQVAQLELQSVPDRAPAPRQQAAPEPQAPREPPDGKEAIAKEPAKAKADADEPKAAPMPPDQLTIAGDAKDLIARRGFPRAIVARPDGLFGLRYDDVEIVCDASGKKIREEKPARPAP